MQRLRNANNSRRGVECARLMLQAMPAAMSIIRGEMRRQPRGGLTMQQFRSLIFAHFHPDDTLSDLAEFAGLSLPAVSRMISLLERRGLVTRHPHATDRRRISLRLTPRGEAMFEQTDLAIGHALAGAMNRLTDRELARISISLRTLIKTFQVHTDPVVHAPVRSRTAR